MQQQARSNPFQSNNYDRNSFQGFQFSYQDGQRYNFGNTDSFGMSMGAGFEDIINEMFDGLFSAGGKTSSSSKNIYDKKIEKKILCSLEELYNGVQKRLRLKDTIMLPHGSERIEKILTVDVKPGYKEGTKITYPPTRDFPKSITLIIKESTHRYLKRYGKYDLIWVCKLTQFQVNNGVIIKIPLLDGKKLTLSTKDIKITNGYRKRMIGFGMPTSVKDKSETSKGDLIIEFKISK